MLFQLVMVVTFEGFFGKECFGSNRGNRWVKLIRKQIEFQRIISFNYKLQPIEHLQKLKIIETKCRNLNKKYKQSQVLQSQSL